MPQFGASLTDNCKTFIVQATGEAGWQNDFSIAPMGLTNSKFDQLGTCQKEVSKKSGADFIKFVFFIANAFDQ